MYIGRKILIIGTSANGKTSLGKKLSGMTRIGVSDLDDLYWLQGWQPKERGDFTQEVERVVSGDSWVISGGNYSHLKPLTWNAADTIIWIDLPIHILLWRALKRSIRRIVKNEACCNGNYETWLRLFGPRSILYWIVKTYRRRRRTYEQAFAEMRKINGSKKLIRLQSQSEVDQFLCRLDSTSSGGQGVP